MTPQLKPQLDCPNCGEKNISGYPCRHCSYDPDMHLESYWSPEIDQIYEDAYSDDEPVGDDGYPLDMDDETKAWLSTNR